MIVDKDFGCNKFEKTLYEVWRIREDCFDGLENIKIVEFNLEEEAKKFIKDCEYCYIVKKS